MSEFARLVVAVLLGAGISFGTTLFFERRREKTTARLAQEHDDRDLRRAARLVWSELLEIGANLYEAVDRSRWWSVPPAALPTEAWTDNRSTLATHLDDKAWETVALGYSSVHELNIFLDSISQDVTGPKIQHGATRLGIHHGSVERALTQLRPFTHERAEGSEPAS